MNILETIVAEKKIEVARLSQRKITPAVNNRDLKTFKVGLATTERLATKLKSLPGAERPTLVAESGIHKRVDVERVLSCGADSILVGEALMKGGSIRAKVAELIGGVG